MPRIDDMARRGERGGVAVAPPAWVFALGAVLLMLAGAAVLPRTTGHAPQARVTEAWRGPLDLFHTQPPAADAEPGDQSPRVLHVSLSAAADLYALFVGRGFQLDEAKRGGEAVPRVVVERLPRDLAALESTDLRKTVFLKTLLPLLLLENERILADRARLTRILADGAPRSADDDAFVARLAERYEAPAGDLRELLRRVDAIPVSLALAQAALETGWGTSRPAQTGHALFGQMVYRDDDDEGRVRSFAVLSEAVEAYAANLNTHRAYGEFRRARANLRDAGKPIDGHALAQHLHRYSERRMDYVRDVRAVMRANGLKALDGARLDGETG
jgi:Bax protein